MKLFILILPFVFALSDSSTSIDSMLTDTTRKDIGQFIMEQKAFNSRLDSMLIYIKANKDSVRKKVKK